ncbi:MAG: hypothetical protein QF415_02035 [Candidatus Undinarchaeales archaeon]|jgi:hypothetical protein|nr:hypothetical protein [Candidatus Undinarchaeales archaeon]MDP7493469.1 hypothetical protein [Candidatus Undinarchaeales archaeon]
MRRATLPLVLFLLLAVPGLSEDGNSTTNTTTPAPAFTTDFDAELEITAASMSDAKSLVLYINETVNRLNETINRTDAWASLSEAMSELDTARSYLTKSADYREVSDDVFMGYHTLARSHVQEARALAQDANDTAMSLQRSFQDRERLGEQVGDLLLSATILHQTVEGMISLSRDRVQEARDIGLDMTIADGELLLAQGKVDAGVTVLESAETAASSDDPILALSHLSEAESKFLDAQGHADAAQNIALEAMGRSQERTAGLRTQVEAVGNLTTETAAQLTTTEAIITYLSEKGLTTQKYNDLLSRARTHREQAATALTSALNRLDAGLADETQDFTLTALDNAQQARRSTTLAAEEARADIDTMVSSAYTSASLILNRTLELKSSMAVSLNVTAAVEVEKGILDVRSQLGIAEGFLDRLKASQVLPERSRVEAALDACSVASELATTLRKNLEAIKDDHDSAQASLVTASRMLNTAMPTFIGAENAVQKRYHGEYTRLTEEYVSLETRFNGSSYGSVVDPARELAIQGAVLETRIKGYTDCLTAIASADVALEELRNAANQSLSGVGAEKVRELEELLDTARTNARSEAFNVSLEAAVSTKEHALDLALTAERNRDDRIRVGVLAGFTLFLFLIGSVVDRRIAGTGRGDISTDENGEGLDGAVSPTPNVDDEKASH